MIEGTRHRLRNLTKVHPTLPTVHSIFGNTIKYTFNFIDNTSAPKPYHQLTAIICSTPTLYRWLTYSRRCQTLRISQCYCAILEEFGYCYTAMIYVLAWIARPYAPELTHFPTTLSSPHLIRQIGCKPARWGNCASPRKYSSILLLYLTRLRLACRLRDCRYWFVSMIR